jgi:hypothetical protein
MTINKEVLKDLHSRLLSLQQSIQELLTVPYADLLLRFNVLMAAIHSFNLALSRAKLNSEILQPISIESNAHLVSLVYLRTKLIPEIENEIKEAIGNDLKSLDNIELGSDFIHNRRYHFDFQETTPVENTVIFSEEGKTEEELDFDECLELFIRYINSGELKH